MLKFTLTTNKQDIEFTINPSYDELENVLTHNLDQNENIKHIKILDEATDTIYVDSQMNSLTYLLNIDLSYIQNLNIDFTDYIKFQNKGYLMKKKFIKVNNLNYHQDFDKYLYDSLKGNQLFSDQEIEPIIDYDDVNNIYNFENIKKSLSEAENVHITSKNQILIFE
jgi:hypothetical protein